MSNKLLDTDKLYQAYPKINEAIDNAENALYKSTNAVTTANAANAKSDDTQQQLNNIVINNGQSDAEVLQARGPYAVLNDRLNDTDAQLAEKTKKLEYKEKQSTFIAKTFEKIRTSLSFSIECNGDSLTYGYDTVSSDIRPADTAKTPSGASHTATRASITYPEALQTFLTEVYGSGKVTVYNRGFSGDNTQTSFNHWTSPSGADIALVMLGTNDASQQTMENFLSWYRKIIERHLDNGTAVVILTPPKTRNTTDTKLDSYVNALYGLGKEYGIEVVDVQEIMSNYSYDIFSDGVHFNGKGYNILGARIASIFIGDGLLNPKKVGINSSLSIRPMVDSVIFNPTKSIVSASGFPTPDEQVSGQGIGVTLNNGDTAYYSVFVDTDDLIFAPSIYFPGSLVSAEVSIDFGTEIPHMTNDFNRKVETASPSDHPVNPITISKGDANIGSAIMALAGFTTLVRNKIGHITKRGWHTIKIKCIDSGTTGLQLHSVDFMSIREITSHGSWKTASLSNGATVNGTYPVEYRKNKQGYTELRGAFTVGTGASGTVIFTLEAGYRPDRQIILVCSNTGATPVGLLVVKINGSVELGSTLASGVSVFIGSQRFEATQ